MASEDHQLHTFSSPYVLPTPLAEFLIEHDGRVIVLVTGVFDVLHQEHIHFLEAAKEQGDFLVVALESDARVRQIKGPDRPHFSQQQRRQHILDLEVADQVVILPEEFSHPNHHRAVISQVRPTYLAVSSHTKHLDKKQAILSEYDGRVVVVLDHNPAESTTQILAK
ncbi:adenylyltransferase/cytidyltransferase family protein [Candidatus Woesebacteria bacterium]|nr:adenylyltransferase/cytidyltransferase family protein [Candidatus Woesebacteria bacterium]